MGKFSQSTFLSESLRLLVEHFGAKEVRAKLDKIAPRAQPLAAQIKPSRSNTSQEQERQRHSFQLNLAEIQKTDPVKFDLLNRFLGRLHSRTILPDAEDIRQFAPVVGLKELRGKGRRELIPPLIECMLRIDLSRLADAIGHAEGISEEKRRQGFSILTDKLVGKS